MSDPTAPHSLLLKAVAVILTNGLAQGLYYEPTNTPKNPRTCPVCPRSAIAIAAGRHPLYAVDWPELCEHYDEDADDAGQLGPEGEAEFAGLRLIVFAENALADHLRSVGVDVGNLPPWEAGTFIERWADAEGRTLPQIVDAMRAAAERGRTS